MLEELRECVAIAPLGDVVQKLSKQLSLRVFAGLPADSICHSGGNQHKLTFPKWNAVSLMLTPLCAPIKFLGRAVPMFRHQPRESAAISVFGGWFDPAFGLIGNELYRPAKALSEENRLKPTGRFHSFWL